MQKNVFLLCYPSKGLIINLIDHTISQTGLKVYAMEDKNKYPAGVKITDDELKLLNITPNKILGKWNCSIQPR